MMKIRNLLMAVAAATFVMPMTAAADGKHGSKITLKNSSEWGVKVYVYNGDDLTSTIAHKKYEINPYKSKTVKCHGNGTKQCYIKVERFGHKDESYAKAGTTCYWNGRDLTC